MLWLSSLHTRLILEIWNLLLIILLLLELLVLLVHLLHRALILNRWKELALRHLLDLLSLELLIALKISLVGWHLMSSSSCLHEHVHASTLVVGVATEKVSAVRLDLA